MKELALLGGVPYKDTKFHDWPLYDDCEIENIKTLLANKQWSRQGSFENKFTETFSKYQGGKYAICVTSGMVALYCALKSIGIDKGDEVIVPAFPQPTALSICYTGATPIFVDIEETSLCIDPQQIKTAITKQTKAIIIVHTHNTMCNMDEILRISKDHKIPIIEDCAHAHGMKWKGVGAGYLGDIGIFSFESSKVMTCGEGGIITTNSKKRFESLMSIKNLGSDSSGKKNPHIIGWNFRMSEFHAAVLLAQLNRFPKQVETKYKNMRKLDRLLKDIDGISTIDHNKNISNHTGFLYSILYDEKMHDPVSLKLTSKALRAEGLPTRIREVSYNSPEIKNYLQEKDILPKCPVAEHYVSKKIFTIPHQFFLGDESDIYDMYEIIKKVISNNSELKGYYYKNIVKIVKDKIF